MASPSLLRIAKIALAVVVAAGFFLLALSGEAYHETSPAHVATTIFGSGAGRLGDPFGISLHVVLRKAYSIAAFALVGLTAELALPPSGRPALRMALLVAAYSGAIEYEQYVRGSEEGPWWNAIDVACGAIGGWIGGWIASRFTPERWKAS
ncbi:MAG: hypothetical protein JWN27_2201 [Candidatus Eremiobacteraeota bacterium]|jgi:hypothetical protein|nr:hypothetical protein [Candidatus Eremiobacteraeota bacterium]